MEEVPEERLQAGEDALVEHDHEGIGISEESLSEHLRRDHGVGTRDRLSFGALSGMHDRFHGEAHAIDQ